MNATAATITMARTTPYAAAITIIAGGAFSRTPAEIINAATNIAMIIIVVLVPAPRSN